MQENLKKIQNQALQEIDQCKDLKSLQDIEVKYLGRKSELTELMHKLKDLSPEEKNLNHQIQSLLSRGLMEAFDELMKSGSSLSNLKCAGIGEILGHSNLVQSGKGKNRNPLVGKFTSYTFINNAFMMLFERYPEPEILESFLGRDLYKLVGELFHTSK